VARGQRLGSHLPDHETSDSKRIAAEVNADNPRHDFGGSSDVSERTVA
jgi:hypothetical protein